MAFGEIYVGSDQPIPFDADTVRVRALAARDYYAAAGVDITELLEPYLASVQAPGMGAADHSDDDLNTDMFPRDEFALPYR